MTHHTLIILILLPLFGSSQMTVKDWVKRYRFAAPLTFVGGVADGIRDVTDHHYHKFKEVHPNANDQYWNNDLSWKNKYNSNWPVAFTDGWHLMKRIDITATIGGGVALAFEGKQKWWVYVVDFLVLSASRQLGFYLTYGVIYND